MAAVNTPVVRKSAALLNYGRCRVSEVSACASAAGALALTATTGLALLLVGLPPVRALLFALKLLPRPGEGPSKSKRDNGHFHVYCLGVAAGGADAPAVVGHVRSGSAGDPGYKATALMAVESALAMALERKGCADGGVLTPAAALGMVLVNRRVRYRNPRRSALAPILRHTLTLSPAHGQACAARGTPLINTTFHRL